MKNKDEQSYSKEEPVYVEVKGINLDTVNANHNYFPQEEFVNKEN